MRRLKEKLMYLIPSKRVLIIDNRKIKLSNTQYTIIKYLSNGEPELCDNIGKAIWGNYDWYAKRTLKVHIYLLNRKCKENIITRTKNYGKYKLNRLMYIDRG